MFIIHPTFSLIKDELKAPKTKALKRHPKIVASYMTKLRKFSVDFGGNHRFVANEIISLD